MGYKTEIAIPDTSHATDQPKNRTPKQYRHHHRTSTESRKQRRAVVSIKAKAKQRKQNIIGRLDHLELITLSSTLTMEVNLGMDYPHVTCEGIRARESLLFTAVLAANLLLLAVVDSILVTSKIVRSAEDAVTRLAGRWVGTCTLVRTLL
jgi:hypothetical protein